MGKSKTLGITRGTSKGPGNGVHETKCPHTCLLALLIPAQTELEPMSNHFRRGCWGDFEMHVPPLPQPSGAGWAPVLNPARVIWGFLLHFPDQPPVHLLQSQGTTTNCSSDLKAWSTFVEIGLLFWMAQGQLLRPFSSEGTTIASAKLPTPKMLYAICFYLLNRNWINSNLIYPPLERDPWPKASVIINNNIQKSVAPGLYVVGSHISQSVLNTKILNFSPT